MLSLNETLARIRQGHLLVRSAREWDDLSSALFRAYDAKDDELIELLCGPFLQSWRRVTTHILADTFDAAVITVTPAANPCSARLGRTTTGAPQPPSTVVCSCWISTQ